MLQIKVLHLNNWNKALSKERVVVYCLCLSKERLIGINTWQNQNYQDKT